MNIERPGHIPIGTLVVLRDRKRGIVEFISLKTGEPVYLVRLKDGSERSVKADDLVRARSVARWTAPGTDWNGDERRAQERRLGERRKAERRSGERAVPGRRAGERRKHERRSGK